MPPAGSAATTSQHAYVFKIATDGVDTVLRTMESLPDQIPPGTTGSGSLTVTNTSSEASTSNVSLSLAAPQGWTLTPSAANLGTLAPGQSATVNLSVGCQQERRKAPTTWASRSPTVAAARR